MTTAAIPLMRVPPGALVQAGTHGVIVQRRGADRWVVRFDTGHVVAADDQGLELLKPVRPEVVSRRAPS